MKGIRLFIATILGWISGSLNCLADDIANPGMYERGHTNLWRSIKQEWTYWHIDPDEDEELDSEEDNDEDSQYGIRA